MRFERFLELLTPPEEVRGALMETRVAQQGMDPAVPNIKAPGGNTIPEELKDARRRTDARESERAILCTRRVWL